MNYLALGHLHIHFSRNGKVYPGPIFPNNLLELEELKYGSFCIFDEGKVSKYDIKLKEVAVIDYNTIDTLNATDEIIRLIDKESIKDKIVILKISGLIEHGRTSDINFTKIESFVKNKGAYVLLRNTSRLQPLEPELPLDSIDTGDIESQVVKKFEDMNQSKFNHLILPLIRALQIEKIEDERSSNFEERLLSETRKIIGI